MSLVSFHYLSIPLCLNYMEVAIFFGSNDGW